jgi:diguanylate cyclase (GGDEF)-like protein/PAS domain S-box-containing protein/excisionase family DNA binding protein
VASYLALPAAHADDGVLRASLDAIVSVDAYGTVLQFNPAAERMFGYTRDDVVDAELAQLVIPPAGRPAYRRALRRLLAGRREWLLEQRIELEAQHADGSLFAIELAITRMAGAGPTALYTGFVRDLTEQNRAEHERRERIARQALVVALGQTALGGAAPPDLVAHALATLVEGLAVERGVALEVEPGGAIRREAAIGVGSLTGHGEPAGEAQAQLLDRTVAAGGSLLLHGAELSAVAEDGLSFVAGMGSLLCVTLHAGRGAVTGLMAIAAADPDALGAGDVSFAQAIATVVGTAAARWRADEKIARLGLHDPLTGLANRPLFEDRLEQALERSRRGQGETGLLLVDLDGFSKLNDGFGHRTGDEVLVGTGARLSGLLSPEATVGRLTGDDFGVLVPDGGSDEQMLALAHRIGIALREPMLAGGRELRTTASVGVLMTEHGVGTAGELLRTVSAAAIRARERGGGRAELATKGMRRRLVHAAEIEQGLRRALTDGELRLHYQPILDLHTGTITAVEAFVRWQHPAHGLLAPAQFLAAAEASGLAVPLGAEILSIACREMAHWERVLGVGDAPAVHVNVSALWFAAPGLASTVSHTLQRSGLTPDKLVLEIAETMFTGEGHAAVAQLDGLRAVGVRIALDRFGTGYSSVAAIRRLPFDALKVDSSVLAEIGDGARVTALVAAMVGIGHSLGLPMTAAKVETEEQLRLLRSLGMDRAQGELFAPPLAATAALELVRGADVWAGLLEATRPTPAGPADAPAPPVPGLPGAAARPSPDATLSLGQAAKALNISTTTVRRWADDGRLGVTRTAGGHRRFAVRDVRRLLAARGSLAIAPTEPPRRALPGLARLAEGHGQQLAELSWRTLYGELRTGFFVDPEGVAAAGHWLGAIASAAGTGNYGMLLEATRAFMRVAEQAGASLLERHVAIERFGETAARALTRRSCPREELVDVRRLFVSLGQGQLADAR